MYYVKNSPRAINHFLNEIFTPFPASWGSDNKWGNAPSVNIHETNEGYHVELNAPGRNKEDFKVQVDNNLLTIGYETKEVTEETEYKTIRREFTNTSFKRSFTLDEKINVDSIQAKYENGILKLFLAKKEEVKAPVKEISIN